MICVEQVDAVRAIRNIRRERTQREERLQRKRLLREQKEKEKQEKEEKKQRRRRRRAQRQIARWFRDYKSNQTLARWQAAVSPVSSRMHVHVHNNLPLLGGGSTISASNLVMYVLWVNAWLPWLALFATDDGSHKVFAFTKASCLGEGGEAEAHGARRISGGGGGASSRRERGGLETRGTCVGSVRQGAVRGKSTSG